MLCWPVWRDLGFFFSCFVFVWLFFNWEEKMKHVQCFEFCVYSYHCVYVRERERWTINRSMGYVMRREIMFVMRFLVNGSQPSLTLSINAIPISAAKPPSAPLSQMGFTLYLV